MRAVTAPQDGEQVAAAPERAVTEAGRARRELVELASARANALAEAERAGRALGAVLPRAVRAGVSVVEAGRLTGLSRPTVYRMLAEHREDEPLRELAGHFEQALAQEQKALPYDLAQALGLPMENVFAKLTRVYPLLGEEFSSFGPTATTTLVEALPELGVPERIVLAMLLLQRLPVDRVAASTQLPETEVLAWAALGLLRVMPCVRAAGKGSISGSPRTEPRSTAASVDRRYRVRDPRRHRSFDAG